MPLKLVAVNGRFTHSCLALYYLRGELNRHLPEQSVELLQFALNDPYHQTLLRIAEGAPRAILFSAYIWSANYVKRLINDLARLLPATVMVVGGPQAPLLGPNLPENCTVVEGEVEGLDEGFYRDLAGGRLAARYRAEAGRPFAMPYRDEDFVTSLANRQIYYESSRGCPFACSYCLSAGSAGVAHKDLARVKEELAWLLRHRPPVVRFVDRTFNARADRTLALWRFLLEQDGESCFHFEIAPELFTEEMLDFLATVPPGRFQFEIGLQSTNPETLVAINRRNDMVRIRANLERLLASDNIHIHMDLILGLPHETVTSFRGSLNEVFAMAPHYIQMGLLKVLPATPISGQVEEFGLLSCQEPPYEVLATLWLEQAELAELYWLGECVESFYNNRFFRSFFAHIRKVETDPVRFFGLLLARCREEGFFARARTQPLMSQILLAVVQARPDHQLLVDLLRFDWLRSGHRALPEHLVGTPMRATRDRLYHSLPREMPPLYHEKSRNRFFKQAVFLDCSGALLREVGLDTSGDPGTVCFLAEQEQGVLGVQQAVLLPRA